MQKPIGAVPLGLGLIFGLVLGLGIVGVANQSHSTTTSTTTTTLQKVLIINEPVFEFFAPTSSGVECEMTLTSTLCITNSPAQRAVVSLDGTFTTCKGVECLSNAGLNTPTLANNTAVDNNHFRCTVGSDATSCVAKNHGGFTISKGGITPAS
jgi:hypothetical protein